ncbi:MAG: hypothetical protein PGMFKBFP_01189 [Anaerolineales bacterium]|nr:hypothetical protein [Anaerolineales bacterium]
MTVPGADEAEGPPDGHRDGDARPAEQSAIEAGILGPGQRDGDERNVRAQGEEGRAVQSLLESADHALASLGSDGHKPSEAQRLQRAVQRAAVGTSAMKPDDAVRFGEDPQRGDVVEIACGQRIHFERLELRKDDDDVRVAKMVEDEQRGAAFGKIFQAAHGKVNSRRDEETHEGAQDAARQPAPPVIFGDARQFGAEFFRDGFRRRR